MADFDFQNKTVCVTGAGRGIGKSLALRLAQLGAKVIAVSKTEENLKQLQAEVRSRRMVSGWLFCMYRRRIRISFLFVLIYWTGKPLRKRSSRIYPFNIWWIMRPWLFSTHFSKSNPKISIRALIEDLHNRFRHRFFSFRLFNINVRSIICISQVNTAPLETIGSTFLSRGRKWLEI